MPLQNRVTPFGEILALPDRGTLTGNRGGRLHDESRRLGRSRWTSRRWIACELVYKDWWRPVMGPGYTELFFLDEVTALAAGHRPCFFCRRAEAERFAAAFAAGQGGGAAWSADAMDEKLHGERLEGRAKRVHALLAEQLPDGAVFAAGGSASAILGGARLAWTPAGWRRAGARPTGLVDVLTPPAMLGALRNGYQPRWHPSATD
jgi:hypothetical protein